MSRSRHTGCPSGRGCGVCTDRGETRRSREDEHGAADLADGIEMAEWHDNACDNGECRRCAGCVCYDRCDCPADSINLSSPCCAKACRAPGDCAGRCGCAFCYERSELR